jgi:hypothetical protein
MWSSDRERRRPGQRLQFLAAGSTPVTLEILKS